MAAAFILKESRLSIRRGVLIWPHVRIRMRTKQLRHPAAVKWIMQIMRAMSKGVKSAFSGTENASVIIVNASEDSTAAVNFLLKNGKAVSLITERVSIRAVSCVIIPHGNPRSSVYCNGIGVEASKPLPQKKISKAPLVYISGKPSDNTAGFVKSSLVSGAYQYNYDRQAMELLGFQVTEDASKADLIIGAAALDAEALAAVKAGTAYIGYGKNAVPSATGLFPRAASVTVPSRGGMDALSYVTYPEETMINASYIAEGDDILYGYGTAYFSKFQQGPRFS